MEIFVLMAVLGPAFLSTIPSSEKPKPKKSNSLKVAGALLMMASTDKDLSDDDREKLDKAIGELTKS